MLETPGCRLWHAAFAACLLMLCTMDATAQEPLPNPPASPDFLSRYQYRAELSGLAYDDDRFSWEGHLSVDLDVIDYVYGRFSILADYQVVMGNQLQPFDPNQGIYTIAGALSARTHGLELAGVFHHVSRHLSDRAKTTGIAMNVLGGRVLHQIALPASTLDVRADFGRVIQHSYVDYTWIGRGSLVYRRPVSPRLAAFGRVTAETYAVNRAVARRDRQNGGRLEGGVRIAGRTAGLELFGGYERVVDADPFDRLPRRWAFAGFRLVN